MEGKSKRERERERTTTRQRIGACYKTVFFSIHFRRQSIKTNKRIRVFITKKNHKNTN